MSNQELSTGQIIVYLIFGFIGIYGGYYLSERDNSSVDVGKNAKVITNAEQIIQSKLKSPSSYRKITGTVMWEGKNQTGNDAYAVKINYDAQNSFGASIRECKVVMYFMDGELMKWNPTVGMQSCNYAGITEEDAIEMFARVNFKDK